MRRTIGFLGAGRPFFIIVYAVNADNKMKAWEEENAGDGKRH
jgi:hypothetical protein